MDYLDDDDLEGQRRSTIRSFDIFLSDIDDTGLLNDLFIFVETFHECLKNQEPRDFTELKRQFEALVEDIGG